MPSDKFLSLEDRIGCWNALGNKEKNTILRQIFEKFQVLEEGTNQFLEIVMRDGKETALPLIPLVLPGTRVNYRTRFLPTVEEWLLNFTRIDK